MGQTVRSDKAIIIILAATLVRGIIFSFTVPIFKAPDENSHFMYITYLQDNFALPYIKFEGVPLDYEFWGLLADERNTKKGFDRRFYSEVNPKVRNFVEANGYSGIPVENFQMPFYYIVCAAGSLLNHGNLYYVFYSSRLISVLFGLGVVLVSYLIAREVFPASKFMVYGLPIFISLIPQFTFSSSTLGNDVPAAFLTSLLFLQVIKMSKYGAENIRNFFWLGVTSGLALITKLSAMTLLPAILVFVAYAVYASRREEPCAQAGIVKCAAVFFLTAGAIIFTSFLHNYLVSGSLTGTKSLVEYWRQKIQYWPLDYDNTSILRMLFSVWAVRLIKSFWGVFGWMEIWLPPAFYWFFYALTGFGAAGFVKAVTDNARKKKAFENLQTRTFLLFAGAIISELILLLMFLREMGGTQAQGRYFFLVLVPLISFMLYGIFYPVQKSKSRSRLVFCAVFLGMMLANLAGYLEIAARPCFANAGNILQYIITANFSQYYWRLVILIITYLAGIAAVIPFLEKNRV